MKPASMKTAKHERWSAELIRIGNLAVREAQARNRQLGIPNWYSLTKVSASKVTSVESRDDHRQEDRRPQA